MSFDDLAKRITQTGTARLGTAASLRHRDGREIAVSVVIDAEVQFVGEFGQTRERRVVASLDVADAGHARLGAVLVIPAGPYQGEYSLAALQERDGFVERFDMRVICQPEAA